MRWKKKEERKRAEIVFEAFDWRQKAFLSCKRSEMWMYREDVAWRLPFSLVFFLLVDVDHLAHPMAKSNHNQAQLCFIFKHELRNLICVVPKRWVSCYSKNEIRLAKPCKELFEKDWRVGGRKKNTDTAIV